MTLVLTVDERGGIAFGNKRQSRDKALTKDIFNLKKGARILAREYSRLIFDEARPIPYEPIFTSDPVKEAKSGDVVLLELEASRDTIEEAEEIFIYSWNRHYPSTAKLDMELIKEKFLLAEQVDFEGNSHENLTRFHYKRK